MAATHVFPVPALTGAAPIAVPLVDARRSIDVITDVGAFARLAPEWNDLVGRASVPHPFLCHEWLAAWWGAFGAGRTLHVVTVRERGELVAAAPLLWDRARMYGLPVRRIALLENDHTPRADVLVAGDRDALIGEIWRALERDRDRWDVVQLSQIPRESPTLAIMSRLAEESGCSTGVWHGESSPYLDLAATDSWATYLQSRPARFRRNLRNRWARFSALGEPTLEVLDHADAIESAADEAMRLESSGWKRQLGTAVACDPATERFYATLQQDGIGSGEVQQYFLKVAGRRIATAYVVRHGSRVFLLKTGYDPEFATGAPSKLMTYLALREACESGVREFDFLGDAEPWKLEWTTTTRAHDWLFVFSQRFKARLLHWLKFQVRPALKRHA